MGHALGVLGHDGANTMRGYTMPFLTDILQLPAPFLMILTTLGQVLDAFTDISMGVIADRTRSKWGRFRPWVLRAGPLFCIFMALSFLKLPIGVVGMCAFAGFMYIATGSFAFTAVDIPFWSLPAAMTSNTKERSEIIGGTTTCSSMIIGLTGIVVPLALSAFGKFEWTSYFFTAAIIAVFAICMYLTSFKLVREHVVPDDSVKFSLKLGLKSIFTNQPLLCVQIANVFFLLSIILRSYLNYYYCTYNLGNLSLAAVLSTINTIGMVSGALLFTIFSKRIGKRNCLFISALVCLTSNLVLYFSGWSNVILLFTCAAITTVAIGFGYVCVNAMIADTIEYGEWKTGQRNEAMITSTRCFVTKCVGALASVLVLSSISLTGFVPQATEQTLGALNGFHIMYSLLPAITMVLAATPMFFYKLTEKRHAEIMVELAARKEKKENK
nr:glycoside-pentoside-hexuronide (GPH):cation symporter [Pseudoflavonifractor phocaeensis]